ncbi:MAG: T9SS type A sorting domain-containing protein [Candidatus Kapabacteria bacterium]|nr:T9SS type A sorting domain-containing protein [Ignavibacteriota bacterium]MCW5884312.1 T9SS type A sorting domain-containing protein [Candidatus Kapabacteria bacterium]
MNKRFFCFTVIFLFLTFVSVFSRQPVEININVQNDLGHKSPYNYSFGISPLATDVLDPDLGELNLPPAPFVGFYTAFEFIDSTQVEADGSKYYDRIWTNKDLRHYPDTLDYYYVRHKMIYRFGNGKKIQINWNKNSIPKIIDSIFIKDRLNGFVINYNMKETDSFEWDNDEIRELFIHVYYNLNTTSVREDSKKSFTVYPNPANDMLNISNDFECDRIEIVDMLGNSLFDIPYQNTINIKHLSSGIYGIRIYNKSGITTSTFVKN